MLRRSLLGRLLLLALLGGRLAACGPGAAPAAPTITFGASISITGKTAKEGEYALDGYQMFMDAINAAGGITVAGTAYKLRLRYYDDQSDPELTTRLYEKLVTEDQVDFLLGPYGSGPTAAAAAVAEKYGIPLVSGHGSAGSIYDQGYRYILSIQTPARNYLSGVLEAILAVDPQLKTVAILVEDESFSREVGQGAVEYAQSRGLEVVANELYPIDTQDLGPQLRTIKRRDPDVLLGAGHLQDALLIVRQAKELELTPAALGLSVGPSSPQFRDTLRKDADYIFGSTQWTTSLPYRGDDPWQTPAAFAAAFRAAYPNYKSVPYQVAESAAALIVFQAGLEKAGTLDREVVRDTIAGLSLMTFFGPIRFDQRGVNSAKPMVVEQLQTDGQKYTVFPLAVAEKPMQYPMPPWDRR